jgi:hypothetical protein
LQIRVQSVTRPKDSHLEKPIKSSEHDEFEDWRRNNLGKSSKRGDFEDWRQKSRIISSKMGNFKDLREIKRYE